MTETEFLALEPREQDALVAEKVMGWTAKRLGKEPWPDGSYCDGITNSSCTEFWFTEEIAPAWQVVEKMREEGHTFVLHHSDILFARFFLTSDGGIVRKDRDYWGEADTAPLAICLAALRAKGVIE